MAGHIQVDVSGFAGDNPSGHAMHCSSMPWPAGTMHILLVPKDINVRDLLLQGPYPATHYWGWVQNGHWPGSAMVHLKSLPEHSVSIDSLHSVIDKVMGEVAAVRHMSATSSALSEPSAKHPAELV